MAIVRERLFATLKHLSSELEQTGLPETELRTSSVDACAGLRVAREARAKDAEHTLQTFERRIEALRATRSEGTDGTSGALDVGGLRMGPMDAGSASVDHDEAVVHDPEVAAAERALRELETSAAFEFEQALWRGGLRGEALQARLQSELDALKGEWLEHKARAESTAIEETTRRVAKKKSLAAYVQQSALNAGLHTMARLADSVAAAGGELSAIAVRALHQRANAMLQVGHMSARCASSGGAESCDVSSVCSTASAALTSLNASAADQRPGGSQSDAALSAVLEFTGAVEALATQLHVELATLETSLTETKATIVASASGEEELKAAASRAGDEVQATLSTSERAFNAKSEAFDAEVKNMRVRAAQTFQEAVTLVVDLCEAFLVGSHLRTSPKEAPSNGDASVGLLPAPHRTTPGHDAPARPPTVTSRSAARPCVSAFTTSPPAPLPRHTTAASPITPPMHASFEQPVTCPPASAQPITPITTPASDLWPCTPLESRPTAPTRARRFSVRAPPSHPRRILWDAISQRGKRRAAALLGREHAAIADYYRPSD